MLKPITKLMLIRALALTAVVFLFLANTLTGGESTEKASAKAHRTPEGAFKSHGNVKLRKTLVDLEFTYGKRKSFIEPAAHRTMVVTQQELYRIVGELKSQIEMPFEIQVLFEECGGPDSFYDDDTHTITICYELIDAYDDLFSRTLNDTRAREEATKGATAAMFLHEVAHALIDGWNLPIAGREEDAADQFSTLLLINGMPNGEQLALDGARSFRLLADLERHLEKDYSDPHSLDEQRFFNTICLVYGHRPEQYEYLVRNGTLPAERAFQCEQDYARVNKSWQTLLTPHLASSNYQKSARGYGSSE